MTHDRISLVFRTLSPVPALLLGLAILLSTGCRPPGTGGNPKVPAGARSSGGLHAVMETEKGSIEIEFLATDSPKAVENFRLLAEHGYYNGLTFHRIVKGFMIQGGDPAGNGSGGESAWGGKFPDEIQRDSALYRRGYRRGLLAMANAGPDTNGSQFFIITGNDGAGLPPNYTLFGEVINGLDTTVPAMAALFNPDPGANGVPPAGEIRIESVTIRES
jgi:cyclophilin family peptidyl-prolyl cis-trans isomerase